MAARFAQRGQRVKARAGSAPAQQPIVFHGDTQSGATRVKVWTIGPTTGMPSTNLGTGMKRALALLLCSIAMVAAISACGGGDTASNDKLTIVGSAN